VTHRLQEVRKCHSWVSSVHGRKWATVRMFWSLQGQFGKSCKQFVSTHHERRVRVFHLCWIKCMPSTINRVCLQAIWKVHFHQISFFGVIVQSLLKIDEKGLPKREHTLIAKVSSNSHSAKLSGYLNKKGNERTHTHTHKKIKEKKMSATSCEKWGASMPLCR
jgi:hypothetical protein